MASTQELFPHQTRVIPTDLEGPERVTAINLRATAGGVIVLELNTANGSVIVECEDSDARDLARALAQLVESL